MNAPETKAVLEATHYIEQLESIQKTLGISVSVSSRLGAPKYYLMDLSAVKGVHGSSGLPIIFLQDWAKAKSIDESLDTFCISEYIAACRLTLTEFITQAHTLILA